VLPAILVSFTRIPFKFHYLILPRVPGWSNHSATIGSCARHTLSGKVMLGAGFRLISGKSPVHGNDPQLASIHLEFKSCHDSVRLFYTSGRNF